jgi:hypothetical protein
VSLICVELYGVEDGLHACTHGIEFSIGNVFDAADITTAEGVDDNVEAIAAVVSRGGIDLITRFSADATMLVIAVRKGDAADRCDADGAGDLRRCLEAALRRRGVRSDAEVKERSAEGGVGVRVEVDVGYGPHLSGVGRVASIEVKGADLKVFAIQIPGSGDRKTNSVAGVMERARRRSGWLGGCSLWPKHRWKRLGLSRCGPGLRSAAKGGESKTASKEDTEEDGLHEVTVPLVSLKDDRSFANAQASEVVDETKVVDAGALYTFRHHWLRMRGLATV